MFGFDAPRGAPLVGRRVGVRVRALTLTLPLPLALALALTHHSLVGVSELGLEP